MNPQGNWLEELEDIAGVAVQYFNDLFSSSPCTHIDECLEAVPQKVTFDMQQALSCDFTADEIKAALFQIGPTKALGPDGMNAFIIRKFGILLVILLCLQLLISLIPVKCYVH